jgi:proteasome accessory factor A
MPVEATDGDLPQRLWIADVLTRVSLPCARTPESNEQRTVHVMPSLDDGSVPFVITVGGVDAVPAISGTAHADNAAGGFQGLRLEVECDVSLAGYAQHELVMSIAEACAIVAPEVRRITLGGNCGDRRIQVSRSVRPTDVRTREDTPGAIRGRAMGQEHEFGLVATSGSRWAFERGEPGGLVTQDSDTLVRRFVGVGTGVMGGPGKWQPNGGLIYDDHGVVEYASPECTSLHELVAHEQAGEAFLNRFAERLVGRLKIEQPAAHAQVKLFKNNVDSSGDCRGTHENYQVRAGLDHLWRTTLVPFLVTRPIFVGAGGVVQHQGEGQFSVSQRAPFVKKIVDSNTNLYKPLIVTRSEHHSDVRQFARVQLTCADANRMPFATFMRFGTTALVISALEDDPTFLKDFTFVRPIHVAHDVARDTALESRFEMLRGRSESAVGVQQRFLDGAAAQATRRGITAEESLVVELWQATLDALASGDEAWLSSRVDWVAKRTIVQRYLDRNPEMTLEDTRAVALDQFWSLVGPTSTFEQLRSAGGVTEMVGAGDYAQALVRPPTSRAAARVALIDRAIERGNKCSINWSQVVIFRLGDDGVEAAARFNLDDPRVAHLDEAALGRLVAI